MESLSSNQSCEGEDLPDNFFDDFSNSDFMDGLNIIDACDGKKQRVLEEDLRDLLRNRKEESARESDTSHIGTRRDPKKTNRDIKKDKEAKVKEHISKRLNSAAGPPGTELDDFNNETKLKPRRRSPSPVRRRKSPEKRRPHEKQRPLEQRRRSPHAWRKSRSPRRKSRSRSPIRRQIMKTRSPLPFRPQRSPSLGPRDSRRRRSSSRPRRRSRSRSRGNDAMYHHLDFSSRAAPVYNREIFQPPVYPQNPEGYYPPPDVVSQQMGVMPIFQPSYYPVQDYSYGPPMTGQHSYFGQPVAGIPQPLVPVPLPVPAPDAMTVPPADQLPPPPPDISVQPSISRQMDDPLDQLLADGKISKEDYLKLKPKHREPALTVDVKEKVKILSRCNDAAGKLGKLHLPNRVIVSGSKSPEQRVQTSFSSPLRREPAVNFNFTSANSANKVQPNKQLVDSIVATIGHREREAAKAPLADSKYKESGTQTTAPFCETCEIRQLTHSIEKKTWIDREHFSASVHTQVVEAELAKSKTMFTPFGSKSEGANISLSHLTPAQLIVSQLAARAKKLEKPSNNAEEHFGRRQADSDNPYYGKHGYHDVYRY